MDFTLASEFQSDLDHNEKLLWTGQPKKGIVFRTSDIFIVPFSLVWCGFAIFWFVSVLASGAPVFFALFGVPFVCIGLIFVFGRFIIDARQRAATFYAVTTERIIIKSGIFRKSTKSLNIRTLSDIEITERRDGSGMISIGPKNPWMMWGNGMNWWGIKPNTALEMIPEVKKVYRLIIDVQRGIERV